MQYILAIEWLSLAEAAEEAGLAPSTLRRQIHNARLAATKKGHDWLVSRAALWTYLEGRGRAGRKMRPLAGRTTRRRKGSSRAR